MKIEIIADLKFVMRDGKRILQMKRAYYKDTDFEGLDEWQDVPLVEQKENGQ